MKHLFIAIFILLASTTVNAQESFPLTGIIKDQKNQILPGAGVYVSGFKIATSANNEGRYTLHLKPGNYDILVQLIGYKSTNRNVVITNKPVQLDITLEESVTQLSEVTIKADPNRQRYINLFKSFFIGTTPNAKECKILNPEVIILDYTNGILSVKTEKFLVIENKALGYKINYLIKNFEYNKKTRIIYYEGYPNYEDLKASASKKKKWSKKRLESYLGSPQHFFQSLYKNTTHEDGYIIYKLVKKDNPTRPSDSLINAKVKQFTSRTDLATKSLVIQPGDSLNYWLAKKRLAQSISYLNKQPVLTDTLVHTYDQNLKSINFTDALYVMYTKEKESNEYTSVLNQSISRPLDIPNYQISLLNILVSPAFFYSNGSIYDPKSFLFEGYWAWEKVADSVPIDYMPPKN
ncbi:carboxypeptidase-like regulatory domain-containing protein [Pedobacter sp. MW01-1-1]|uniref:carboxypeptidase-like regulatory domain-containing protein n=1 Tax=Pedobacter sp. MW01-1-1 TaxID=3383027 RepID=UPI003FEFA321